MSNKNVGPSAFHGLPWESWTNSLGRSVPLEESVPDAKSTDKNKAGVMKLPKEDMKIFGLCPEKDAFSVVICETCNMCVKPQALLKHFETRHLNKDAPPVVLPIPERPIVPEKTTAKVLKPVVKGVSAKVKRKRATSKETNIKNNKEAVVPSLPVSLTLESGVGVKESVTIPATPASTPPITPGPVLSNKLESASTVNVVSSPLVVSAVAKSPAKSRRAPRKNAPIKQREYDPDKHCGVVTSETMKPCTWSLTCKSHPMSLRRAVTGRSKPFDQLLADHRKAKETLIKQKKNLDVQNAPVILMPLTTQPINLLTTASSQEKCAKDKETVSVINDKTPVVNVTARVSSVTSASVSVTSASASVSGMAHTVTTPSSAVPTTKQNLVLNSSVPVSWNLSLVSTPLVCRLPELKLDVTPAKRIYLSQAPSLMVKRPGAPANVEKPATQLPMPVFVSVSPATTTQLDILSVSLSPPRALSVPTPLFSQHKIGGLLYTNRRMQMARQNMEARMHQKNNGFPHSAATIYHLPSSFFTSVLDSSDQSK